MAPITKPLAITLFALLLLLAWWLLAQQDFLSFEYLKSHHLALRNYVDVHYVKAATIFMLLYLSTSLVVPGALALTVAGGALFGTIATVCYVNAGATLGAVLAFLATRYFFAGWVQERFRNELQKFNHELVLHGHNYLLTLRIIPILPAFLINYLAGLTKIPTSTFVWTTSLGVLPGSAVYAYAGSRLGSIQKPGDLISWEIVIAFALLGIFSLLPVIVRHGKKLWR
ncbi:TVP38/TMEM64 family protein [Geobacter sp. DSM 9736]|uniref:TVP38/TMEM64 family protein n=1 Tax=Geobacter sp. DSM 9736 TaxID=1277350 RepID=UPI000B50BA76|nr:TVP38/TMEM64 family protein [Geobacter sp. DSM 9736]SNB46428.1 Uncharacterized membrane protein YdjX, TVP38/TMEM64 family, SNARE-associated domain [Geobacter sp. DSM 9736]